MADAQTSEDSALIQKALGLFYKVGGVGGNE